MKRILVALLAGTVIGSLLTGLTYLSSADGVGSSSQTASQLAAAATPASALTPAAPVITYSGQLTGAARPIPENVDPVLGTKKWGTRSSRVKGARGQAVTSEAHSEVEAYENRVLARQQAKELLELFEDSRGVHRLIDKYGGDPDDAMYYVQRIRADEDDPSPNNQWVNATLRADFASPEGRRAIEMVVYRRKTDEGLLDNTPYVAMTQVGYIELTGGALSITSGYRHLDEDEFAVSHDQLETIRFKN
jgi:hypothetical protein